MTNNILRTIFLEYSELLLRAVGKTWAKLRTGIEETLPSKIFLLNKSLS